MSCKEEFIEIFKANITREGADKLLDYLEHKVASSFTLRKLFL